MQNKKSYIDSYYGIETHFKLEKHRLRCSIKRCKRHQHPSHKFDYNAFSIYILRHSSIRSRLGKSMYCIRYNIDVCGLLYFSRISPQLFML